MTWRWRKIGAVAAVFVAVAALAVVLVALHRPPTVLRPATNPSGFGTFPLAPIVRPGMKIVPMQVRPNPGECEGPAIPVGGTVPPCP